MAYDLPVPPGASLASAQARLNAIVASGQPGTLILSGNYTWAGTLTLQSGTRVGIAMLNARITQTTAEVPTIYINDSAKCRITGGYLVGKGTETPWSSGTWNGTCGILVDHSDDVDISGVHLSNHAGGGICFTATCNRLSISRNTIIGMGAGVVTAGSSSADFAIGSVTSGGTAVVYQCDINDNHISGHGQGIGVIWCRALTISNNRIYAIPGQHGMYCSLGGDAVISGNVLRDCYEDGIKVSFNTAADRPYPVNIVGNSIHDVGANGINVCRITGGETYFRENCSIVGNVVDTADTVGIIVSGQKGIHIAGNRVSNTGNVGYDLSGSGTFTGNTARGCEGAGLRLRTPEGNWSFSEFDCVDSPINAGESTNGEMRSCMYLDDGAAPTSVYMNGIRMWYENETAPATEGADLQYAINSIGSDLTVNAGIVTNLTGEANSITGTLVEAIAGSVVPPP